MATGIGSAAANSALDTIASTYSWLQLHTGSPGAAGTSNVAGNTTRKQPSWASASGGSKSTNADVNWTAVSTAETYTHFTLWTASSAGTFGASGTVTANAVGVGDNFTLTSGNATLSFTLAS